MSVKSIKDIELLKRPHFNGWGVERIACPQSFSPQRKIEAWKKCDCGADDHNKKIDALLDAMPERKLICPDCNGELEKSFFEDDYGGVHPCWLCDCEEED